MRSHRQKRNSDFNDQGMKSARGQKSHLSGTPQPLNGDEGVNGENDEKLYTQTDQPL